MPEQLVRITLDLKFENAELRGIEINSELDQEHVEKVLRAVLAAGAIKREQEDG